MALKLKSAKENGLKLNHNKNTKQNIGPEGPFYSRHNKRKKS